jgi:nucleoside 2-deoxyribosyltransferase
MAYRIFLSHSEKDPKLLASIREAAHAAGVELYTFEDDPQPGSNLKEKLLGALQASDAVVALLTPNAAISPTVQQEIGAALQLKKPIIPLFADGVEVARFPFLAEIEYVKISTDDLLLPCVLTVR